MVEKSTIGKQRLAACTIEWYIRTSLRRPHDRKLSGPVAARLFRRGYPIAKHPVRSRRPALSEAPDDRRCDDRPGLRVPPSNHFEKLRGNLAGMHSIRVKRQWRLVFRWDGSRGEAEGVYLDDHSYR